MFNLFRFSPEGRSGWELAEKWEVMGAVETLQAALYTCYINQPWPRHVRF